MENWWKPTFIGPTHAVPFSHFLYCQKSSLFAPHFYQQAEQVILSWKKRFGEKKFLKSVIFEKIVQNLDSKWL